jgi:hypothetical protein
MHGAATQAVGSRGEEKGTGYFSVAAYIASMKLGLIRDAVESSFGSMAPQVSSVGTNQYNRKP